MVAVSRSQGGRLVAAGGGGLERRPAQGAVAALVAGELAVAHLDYTVGDAVEEVAVVGDEDHRAGEPLQLRLQNFH